MPDTMPNPDSPPVLVSLASRQVWPHVLVTAHIKPQRLVLLHSNIEEESKRPAQRLQKFLHKKAKLLQEKPELRQIPHDDFLEAVSCIAETMEGLPPSNDCILNITGGNKLMATAAFHWAATHSAPSKNPVRICYLERGNELIRIEPSRSNTGLVSRREHLDPSIANDFNPLDLLRCQLQDSEVKRNGERLVLKPEAKSLSDTEFQQQLEQGRAGELVRVTEGKGDGRHKEGDELELRTAAAILRVGLGAVYRSVELKVRESSKGPLAHSEIDVLFNWSGKLWLVDCKDKISSDDLVKGLKRTLGKRIPTNASELIDRISSELEVKDTKVLKEDLISIKDVGGLLGQVVCVRKAPLPDVAQDYAERNHIEVILKKNLLEDFRKLLNPGDASQVHPLVEKHRLHAPSRT